MKPVRRFRQTVTAVADSPEVWGGRARYEFLQFQVSVIYPHLLRSSSRVKELGS